MKNSIRKVLETYKPNSINKRNIIYLVGENVYNYIFEKTEIVNQYEPSLKDRIYMILNDDITPKKCNVPGCDNNTLFRRKTCCRKCENIYNSIKQKETYSDENKKDDILKRRNTNKDTLKASKNISKGIKNYYKKLNENIKNASIFSLEQTKQELKKSKINFSSQNISKKLKENPSLYKSVFFHVDEKYCTSTKITEKIYKLLNDEETTIIKCKNCEKPLDFYTFDNPYSDSFLCKNCFSSLSNYNKNLHNHGYDYAEQRYAEYRNIRKGLFTKKWYIERFGYNIGQQKFQDKMMAWHSIKNCRKTTNKMGNSYSQSSQQLFFELLKYIKDKEMVMFAEHKGEKIIKINANDILKNSSYISIDFLYLNYIIEFDCFYWHDKNEDKKRDIFLKQKGYNVKRVNYEDWKLKKNREKIIKDCLNFMGISNV